MGFGFSPSSHVPWALSSENQDRIGEEEFIRLFGIEPRARAFAFIVTFLPDWGDAEEVLSCARASCSGRNGPNFNAAVGSLSLGLRHRPSPDHGLPPRVPPPAAVLQRGSRRAGLRSGSAATRCWRPGGGALCDCLGKLSASDRRIIDGYYVAVKKTAAELGAELGRPANTVLSRHRIRRALHHCIDRKVAVEERQ